MTGESADVTSGQGLWPGDQPDFLGWASNWRDHQAALRSVVGNGFGLMLRDQQAALRSVVGNGFGLMLRDQQAALLDITRVQLNLMRQTVHDVLSLDALDLLSHSNEMPMLAREAATQLGFEGLGEVNAIPDVGGLDCQIAAALLENVKTSFAQAVEYSTFPVAEPPAAEALTHTAHWDLWREDLIGFYNWTVQPRQKLVAIPLSLIFLAQRWLAFASEHPAAADKLEPVIYLAVGLLIHLYMSAKPIDPTGE